MAARTKAEANGTNGAHAVERIKIPAPGKAAAEKIVIPRPNIVKATFRVVGTAPLVINKFSNKAREEMRKAQEAGSQGKKGKQLKPKNFQQCYEGAKHYSTEGWEGISAPAFRNAMIDACRMVGFKMTHAKCSVFIEKDGTDRDEHTPLVKILGPGSEYFELPVRNDNGSADIRARPMYREWWVDLRVSFNADQFSLTDMANLLMHAGISCGVGEGRPFSKESAGMGWGTFTVDMGDDE
jgi:hypothetical protein